MAPLDGFVQLCTAANGRAQALNTRMLPAGQCGDIGVRVGGGGWLFRVAALMLLVGRGLGGNREQLRCPVAATRHACGGGLTGLDEIPFIQRFAINRVAIHAYSTWARDIFSYQISRILVPLQELLQTDYKPSSF